MRPLRVALFIPTLEGGGAERVCLNLANGFVELGMEVDLVLMRKSGVFLGSLSPAINIFCLEAERFRSAGRPLVNYLLKRRPACLLAFMWPLALISQFAATAAGRRTKTVLCEHIDVRTGEGGSAIRRVMTRLSMILGYRMASAIVAVSEGVAESLARFALISRERISVIHNPLTRGVTNHSALPRPLLAEEWASRSHGRLLAVARFVEQKDLSSLIRAFVLVSRQVDARLLILGDGPLRYELEKLCHDLGVSDRVDLPGYTSDVDWYYERADLFILSSRWEGFGNVVVESLEKGTSVVSTDCRSGPREILDNGRYGTLVPVGDVRAMADGIIRTLQHPFDPDLLRTRAGDFTIAESVQRYARLITDVTRREDRS
jgi:glycosyltransferase involved in cell wall biosynthesis